jgi:glycosyltransferase involved in cell wall biosynthesis
MNFNPLISVIINTYNGEKYVQEAIQSVINQSYKNWEIIFWDNCSTDNTEVIVKKFKEKKIRYFKSIKLTSLYEARNLAVKKAKGKFICFLDSDDLWLKDKLNYQINFFNKNKDYQIQYSNYFTKLEKNNKKYLRHKKYFESGKITQNLLNNYSIGILTVFLKKSIFSKILFDKKYNVIGDFDFFIKLSKQFKIAYIPKPLAVYRVHENNYSYKNLNRFISELEFWIKKNDNILKNKNFSLLKQKYFLFKLKVKLFLIKNLGV